MINFISNQNVPRESKRETLSYTLDDVYHYYRRKNPQVVKTKDITRQEFRDILENVNMMLIDEIFKAAFELKLPFSLGVLSLTNHKTMPHRRKINFEQTKRTGITTYYDNSHSWGRHFKLYWKKGPTTNISFYRFDLTRHNKRYISTLANADQIKSNPTPY